MNPLADVLPPLVRKYLYAAVFLGLLVFAAINAADGDWSQVVLSLLTSLAPLLAASNVTTNQPEVNDGLSYEEAGGGEYPSGLYGQTPPLNQPGSDADGWGGDAPEPRL